MPTIININIGGTPLLPSSGDRAFKHIPVEVEEFDNFHVRAFAPSYFDGLTPIPDQIFTRAKNCKKGQQCGDSCISLAKTCKKNLTPAQKPAAKNAWVKTKGKKSSGAAESATQAGKGAVDAAKVKPAIDKALAAAKGNTNKISLLTKKMDEFDERIDLQTGDYDFLGIEGKAFSFKDMMKQTNSYANGYFEGDPVKYKNLDDVHVLDVSFNVNGSYDMGQSVDGISNTRLGLSAIKGLRKKIAGYPDGTIVSNRPWDDDGGGRYRAKIYEKMGMGTIVGKMQFAVVVGGKLVPTTPDQILSQL